MNVGPMGMIGSAAGSPLAQGQGSEVSKAQQDTSNQARQTQLNEKAEKASGVGQTEQDEQTSDRDADGRRPWEIGPQAAEDQGSDAAASGEEAGHQSKDPTGERGNQLDLSG